jgi:glycosyltransferase involved in cell wall biosynthesis
MKIRVLHLISVLPVGGSQMMLHKLLSRFDRDAFETEVACLGPPAAMAERISTLGIAVRCFGIEPGKLEPGPLLRFAAWLRRNRFHVVQTWMYHADLVGGLAAKLAGKTRVAWGIRQSNLDAEHNKRGTLWIVRMCARLSRWLPARIVCCSEVARKIHVGAGYASEKMLVIPNGFDLDAFRPDPAGRSALRDELGIPQSSVVIGHVARFDSQKDHRTFVRAAGLLGGDGDVHFLMCGEGVDRTNRTLAEWISAAGLERRTHLLGLRDDVARVHAALDVEVSSSVGEGFSNVVGEAMACGVPCVATDVGDARDIMGDTGRVVPVENPAALAEACAELVAIGPAGRAALGASARRRIDERFSLSSVVARYQDLYRDLTGDVRH